MRYSSERTAVHARLRLDPDRIDGRSHPMRRLGLRAVSTAALVAALVTSSLGAVWPRPSAFASRADAAAVAAPVGVAVDGARRFQRIDGFGVNANPKHWNGGELVPAIDLLTDTLGTTLWRVDMFGTSTWETVNDDADPAHFEWASYNAIYESPDFQELWSTLSYLNQKGVRILLSASGVVPGWMGGTVIDPNREDEFVEMIVSAAYYARNVKGIRFTLLDPLNETNFGAPEGPKVDPAQFARLMGKFVARLDALGMGDVQLVAPETTSFNVEYLPPLMADAGVMARLQQFAFHSYAGAGADFAAGAIARSAYPDRRIWVTEWNQIVTDGSLDGGVGVKDEWAFAREMTSQLFNHLEAGASAALAWDAYDNVHEHDGSGRLSHWGLLAYDPSTGRYAPKPRFYTNAQVFRFVPAGAWRVEATTSAPDVRVLAFYDDATGQLTLVGQNTGATAAILSGTLANVGATAPLRFYQTTSAVNLAPGPDVPVAGGRFSVEVAPDSFFTLTTPGGPTPPPASTPTAGTQPGTATPTATPRPATATPTATATVATAPQGRALVGDQQVEAGPDSNPAGTAEAFAYTAVAGGTVTRLALFLDGQSTATTAIVGLYSSGAGDTPGSLLTQGTIASPQAGTWNTIAVPPAAVSAGQRYWIAVLAPPGAGTLWFRDVPAGGGSTQTSARADLAALPAVWSTGTVFANAPLSAFALEDSAAATASPTATAVTAPATATATPTATATATPTVTAPAASPTRTATTVPPTATSAAGTPAATPTGATAPSTASPTAAPSATRSMTPTAGETPSAAPTANPTAPSTATPPGVPTPPASATTVPATPTGPTGSATVTPSPSTPTPSPPPPGGSGGQQAGASQSSGSGGGGASSGGGGGSAAPASAQSILASPPPTATPPRATGAVQLAGGKLTIVVPGRARPATFEAGTTPHVPDEWCPSERVYRDHIRLQDTGIAGATFGITETGALDWIPPLQAGCVDWARVTAEANFPASVIMQLQILRPQPGALLWVQDGDQTWKGRLYEVAPDGQAHYVSAAYWARSQEHFQKVWPNVMPVSWSQMRDFEQRGFVGPDS
jgi:O-glycosyl hydrolase/uncharacterized membrane protein YgcG